MAETKHWINTAAACGYLDDKQAEDSLTCCDEIGKMMGAMMANPDMFCLNEKRG
ncbi:MAG: four helix bundle protein [Deltaproteobacteria bacterium]|nr:four helix bundle protein [Deltaproteobacteria bacterium]MBW2034739.1 four helix bundle protein [Deltaproteobacteria bacterium]MBW2115850.1 four helix bundle protein [Deltaproteobacteria bacterium]MBW2346170.1 four helix bundle protein [Deltaproteobacteria bacterium]